MNTHFTLRAILTCCACFYLEAGAANPVHQQSTKRATDFFDGWDYDLLTVLTFQDYAVRSGAPPMFCLPSNFSPTELMKEIKTFEPKYSKNNNDLGPVPAEYIGQFLLKKYPCPRSTLKPADIL